jgi:tRNA threonylcarbamoyl adenosine modification protein YeaZ
MYLFIDTLSEPTYICLFDKVRNIVDSHTWPGKQKEFDTLSNEIDELLSRNALTYSQLSGIVVMVWPGGFTGTRVTTLVANSLAYSFGIPLFPLTVWDFFAYQDVPLPWIIAITRKEVLLWQDKKNPLLCQMSDLPEGNYSTLAPIDFDSPKHTIQTRNDHTRVVANLPLKNPQNKIQPLYAKDPNITLKSHGS